MPDVAELRRLLEMWTGDLAMPAGAAPDALADTRKALAVALAKSQKDPPFGARPFVPTGTDDGTATQLAAIAAAAVAEASAPGAPPLDYQIARRTARAWPHFEPEQAQPWTSGRLADQTYGPFLNGAGERVFFDAYRARTPTQLMFAGTARPVALLTSLGTAEADGRTFPVHRGTVWIPASLLAAGAPDGWCGLRVSGGELRTDQQPTSIATSLVCPGGAADLSLELESLPGVAGESATGADADSASLRVLLPSEVRLRLTNAGAEVRTLTDAQLTAYGASVQLMWAGGAPMHDSQLNAVVVPMRAEGDFTPVSAKSATFAPSGTASILSGGWGLPITLSQTVYVTETDSAGIVTVTFGDGLQGRVPPLGAPAVRLRNVTLAAAPQRLALFAPQARTRRAIEKVSLWQTDDAANSKFSALEITTGDALDLLWIANAGTAETLTVTARVEARLDRPVRSDGRRFKIHAPNARVTLQTDASGRSVRVDGELPRLELAPDGVMRPIPRPSLALPNALLRTSTPTRLRLTGRLDASGRATGGAAALSFVVYTLIPTLPDPYAANIDLSPLEAPTEQPAGELATLVTWRPTGSPAVDLFLVAGRLDDALLPAVEPPVAPLPGDEDQRTRERREQDTRALNALAERFRDAIGRTMRESARLLDLSSAADRFGVGIGGFDDRRAEVPDDLTFARGELVAPLGRLRAFTVPAIQWEPVYTVQNPDLEPFPSPVRFPHDGGPTLLGTNSVRLVPVSPGPVVERIVVETQAAGSETRTALLTTLPFGKAAVMLPHRSPLDMVPGGMLDQVRPLFPQSSLTGGLQVSARGTRAAVQPTEESLTLPGSVVQLRNARGIDPKTGTLATVSVLGDMAADVVETTFNAEFGPDGFRELVPVSRFDLSGYGASLFSDWRNLSDAIGETTQVRFDVMVGRTAYEVVQIRSIKYPYAVRVVRTVILQRTSAGQVVRQDSGWQPASDGLYEFPVVPVAVHPGVVRGAYNIRRIRDTPHVFETADQSARLAAVLFDADLEIEGAISGHTGGHVPTRGHIGYILLPPGGAAIGTQPQPLTPAQFAELIEREGALGGPVDCEIDIGGSGQRMRVTHVEVSTAPVPGGAPPQFAAAARGSLKLPLAGQWTVTFRSTETEDVVAVDQARGVSLVRQGPAGTPASASPSPYRFADARDLLAQTPRGEYGLLAVCDVQRLLFPAPKIERGSRAITSTVAPLFADMYAISSCVGIFPSRTQVIQVPTTAHSLEILPDGGLVLRLPFQRFTVTAPRRDLLNNGSVRTYVEYSDERGRASEVELHYDTRLHEPFEILVHHISVVTDIDPFDRIVLMRGRIRSSLTTSDLEETKVVFGSVMAPVQEIVTVLQDIGFPAPFDVKMTNSEKGSGPHRKYKLKVNLEFELERLTDPPSPLDPNPNRRKPGGYIETGIGRIKGEMAVGIEVEVEYNPRLLLGGELPRLPPGTLREPEKEQGKDLLEKAQLASLPSPHVSFFAEASADLHVPIIGQLLYAGGHFGMEIETLLGATLATKLKLIVGASGMIGGKVIPKLVELEATVRRAVVLVFTDDGPRPGLLLGLEGSAAVEPGGFKLIGISFGVEAQGVVKRVDEDWIAFIAELKFAADVTVAHFLSSGIDIETEYHERVPTKAVAALAIAMAIPGYP